MWRILICLLMFLNCIWSDEKLEIKLPNQIDLTTEQIKLHPTKSNIVVETPSPEISKDTDLKPINNRIITYDQRQEGQYNIRADLDNFMILLIPQNPLEGLSMLELLAQSPFKRHNLKKSEVKKHNLFSKNRGPVNLNFISKPPQETLNVKKNIPHFLEGRTPYKVDLTSGSDLNTPVDVLPPQYPLSYQLLKPYHLEAEQTTIQSGFSPDENINQDQIYSVPIKENFPMNDLNSFQNSKTIESKEGLSNIPLNILRYPNIDGFDDVRSKTNEFILDYNSFGKSTGWVSPLEEKLNNWKLKFFGIYEDCGEQRTRDSYGKCKHIMD